MNAVSLSSRSKSKSSSLLSFANPLSRVVAVGRSVCRARGNRSLSLKLDGRYSARALIASKFSSSRGRRNGFARNARPPINQSRRAGVSIQKRKEKNASFVLPSLVQLPSRRNPKPKPQMTKTRAKPELDPDQGGRKRESSKNASNPGPPSSKAKAKPRFASSIPPPPTTSSAIRQCVLCKRILC